MITSVVLDRKMNKPKDRELSDNEKLQIIHSLSKKQIKKWSALPREAKQQVLDGLDIATDTNWVLGLIEEAKDES